MRKLLRSNTAIIIAMILLYGAVWTLVIWQISAERQYQAVTAQYQSSRGYDRPKKEDCTRILEPISMAQCIERVIQAEREDRRSEYDLAAQQEMAYWTPWALLCSVVTAFIALVGTMYVRDTLLETRKIGEAQVRSYINISDIIPKWGGDDGITGYVDLTIQFRNNGQSPARNLRIFRKIMPIGESDYGIDLNIAEDNQNIPKIFAEIGPGMTVNCADKRVPVEEIREIFRDGSKLIAYARVTYDDIFLKGHTTEVCTDIIRLKIPSTQAEFESAKENFGVRFTFYPKHNYSD